MPHTLTWELEVDEYELDVEFDSKLGTSSLNFLHSCAYIELYLGSSNAFSKIRSITPLKMLGESSPREINSSLSLRNFSGVILLSILKKTREWESVWVSEREREWERDGERG